MGESRQARLGRIELAQKQLAPLYCPECLLCELRCRAKRSSGEVGACGLAKQTYVYHRLVLFGEESPLVPSYAIWLSGCNFECTFCSEARAHRQPLPGKTYSPGRLADEIASNLDTHQKPVRNINFVGGEPALNLPFIADVAHRLVQQSNEVPALLLNTNGWLTPNALAASIDLFDVFLVDLKFGNDSCASELGAPERYSEILKHNLNLLVESKREVWVRHLLIPGHIDCCTKQVLKTLESWPSSVNVNLMPAFVDFNGNLRSLRTDEIERARKLLAESKLAHRFWDGKPVG